VEGRGEWPSGICASGVVQEQTGGNSAIAPTAAANASAIKKDNRMNNSIDSNQKTLVEFKKILSMNKNREKVK